MGRPTARNSGLGDTAVSFPADGGSVREARAPPGLTTRPFRGPPTEDPRETRGGRALVRACGPGSARNVSPVRVPHFLASPARPLPNPAAHFFPPCPTAVVCPSRACRAPVGWSTGSAVCPPHARRARFGFPSNPRRTDVNPLPDPRGICTSVPPVPPLPGPARPAPFPPPRGPLTARPTPSRIQIFGRMTSVSRGVPHAGATGICGTEWAQTAPYRGAVREAARPFCASHALLSWQHWPQRQLAAAPFR